MASLLFVAGSPASEETWTSVHEAKWNAALLDVYFVDNQHGWVVGGESTILHTADGGKTWKSMGLQKTRHIHRVIIHFIMIEL